MPRPGPGAVLVRTVTIRSATTAASTAATNPRGRGGASHPKRPRWPPILESKAADPPAGGSTAVLRQSSGHCSRLQPVCAVAVISGSKAGGSNRPQPGLTQAQRGQEPTASPMLARPSSSSWPRPSHTRPRRAQEPTASPILAMMLSSSSSLWHLPWPIVSLLWISVLLTVTSNAPVAHGVCSVVMSILAPNS